MNLIVRLFILVVAGGLTALTIAGAHALTGRVSITLVLSALVILQWGAARGAMNLMRHSGGKSWTLRRTAAVLGMWTLWFATATVTVPFVGAELYGMFTAGSAATTRFEAEQRRLAAHAIDIDAAYGQLRQSIDEFGKYADGMAREEQMRGGGCLVTLGPGAGDLHAFRKFDLRSATALSAKARPQLETLTANRAAVEQLRFGADVAEVRRNMNGLIAQLDAARRSPLLDELSAFVADAEVSASNIQVGGKRFVCEDKTRALLLAQISSGVRRLQRLPPLDEVNLLDPSDSRAIAQATVLRTWASVIGWLPERLLAGKLAIDPALTTKFAVKEDAVLSEANMSLIFAWLCEGILVALLFLDLSAARAASSRNAGAPSGVVRWALGRLRERGGLIGAMSAAALGGMEASARSPADSIFADEAMEERARTVAVWFRPWGNIEALVIPLTEFAAIRAARELKNAGLLVRLASGIRTSLLARDRRLMDVLQAVGGEVPETVWEVYRVADEALARWLLAQPLEARAVIDRSINAGGA